MKNSKTSGILALSLVLALALSACGSADLADTSTSFAADDVASAQFDVATIGFASSFAASFADDAAEALSASFEGMSEGLSASVDVYGTAYETAHAAADQAGKLAASVEGASDDAYAVAYAETFSVAYGEAYAAEYDSAMQTAASVAIDDLSASINADIAELESAITEASVNGDPSAAIEAGVEVGDDNLLGASFEDAMSEAQAASVEVDGGSAGTSSPSVTLNVWTAVIILLAIGGGFWLLRFNRENA